MSKSTASTTSLKLIMGIGLISMILGYFFYTAISSKAPNYVQLAKVDQGEKTGLIGTRRPDFELPDMSGKLFSSSQMDSKVVLVNFWATWCPPCRKEMPGFVDLKTQYGEKGFEIIGIAIDELTAVQKFSAEQGLNYPVLHGQTNATEVSRLYGNQMGALPFSVLLDRDGNIQFLRAGELHRNELETELLKYL